ncbi:nucleotidyltransferase family protein [Paenibacillus sp. CAU 1782]
MIAEQENRLREMLSQHPFLARDLVYVEALKLPHWCISAGYIRNYVWDCLHEKEQPTPLNDVDVLYYDDTNLSEDVEKHCEELLIKAYPHYRWSVKNQARMHRKSNLRPYQSVEHAMKHWPETATAVGVALDEEGRLEIIAPHGLEDLFGLLVRQSPYFADRNYFFSRIKRKGWLERWPKLVVVD